MGCCDTKDKDETGGGCCAGGQSAPGGCGSGGGKGQGHGHYQRSHEPVVWSLFGAGGMLAAFVIPPLLLCTALLAPLGLLGDGLAFERVAAFVNHWLGALILWAVIALPLWHALHRVYHGLHDLKVGARPLFFVLCYGSALLLTLYSGYLLLLA